MYSLIKAFLFSLEPERAHALSMRLLKLAPSSCFPKPQFHPVKAMGLDFPHRIGLAAGFDKTGEHVDALAKLGFAFIELGTVTPKPQLGNPKPRLFRLAKAHALINRMGFNNPGVDKMMSNLKSATFQGVLGINIGKGRDTPLVSAKEDYLYCMSKAYARAAYLAINISSPNTQDLRELQRKEYFFDLVKALRDSQLRLSEQNQRYVPLLIKISPDESSETLKQMADVALNLGIDGMIVSNTSCDRPNLAGIPLADQSGGLSGQPIFSKATQSLAQLKKLVGDDLTLIGVGGIDSLADAEEKLAKGATLLQIYTGLIYHGPWWVGQLSRV